MLDAILANAVWDLLKAKGSKLANRFCKQKRGPKHGPADPNAARTFKSLQPLVEGLLEQVQESAVNENALTELKEELEKLSIFPPAIQGMRGRAYLEDELQHVLGLISVPEERRSAGRMLKSAQRRFRRHATLSEPGSLRRRQIEDAWDDETENPRQ